MIFKFATDAQGEDNINLLPNPKTVRFDGKNFIVKTDTDIDYEKDYVYTDSFLTRVFNRIKELLL